MIKGLVVFGIAMLAGLQQTTPVFRARTDLAVLDVVVTDASGAVVSSLTPTDFIITTKKGARTIASLEFIRTRLPATHEPPVLPEPDLAMTRPSTNVGKSVGRTFLLAIDLGEIRAGEGRVAMQQVVAFVDALPPEDLVGLVVLPNGTPRVELTTDRRAVRETLSMVVGASDRYRSCGPTLGEAAGISIGDTSARKAWAERTSKDHCLGGFPANVAIAEYRMQTRIKLDALGALADRMARLAGQKTIVLVSEGLFTDRETQLDIARFGARAEAAHVRLYALHLDTPVAEAAYNVPADTHNLDDHLGFDGMADVATATGGTALRAVAQATGPLNQIDREASGYYLLSVETDPSERDGKPVDIKIRVRTAGLEVRARPAFVHAPAPTPLAVPADLKAAIGDTLRWPVDETAFRMDVDVVRLPATGSTATEKVLMLAEFDEPPAALGFEITDATNKVVADSFEAPVSTAGTSGQRALYAGSASLAPGDYRLKLAVIGRDGKRGGVTHHFTVAPSVTGTIRISDVLLGADSGSPWRPIAAVAAGQSRVGVRVDFSGDTAESLATVTARLRVGRIGQAGWLADATLPVASVETDPLSRSARGAVNLAGLAPGDYVLKVELLNGETVISSTAKVIQRRPPG